MACCRWNCSVYWLYWYKSTNTGPPLRLRVRVDGDLQLHQGLKLLVHAALSYECMRP
jgi:hypothetical protein